MNTQKIRKSIAKKKLAKPKGKFKALDYSMVDPVPRWLTRAFSNNHYTVMIDDNAELTNGDTAIKAMIQRHDDRPLTRHWREIQEIKNEIFGAETVALEFYPPESEVIDDHNIYWIWIIKDQPRYKRFHTMKKIRE